MLSHRAFFSIRLQVAVLLLVVQTIGFAAHGATPSADALQNALRDARKIAPAGFTSLIQPPFVVVGNEPSSVVRQRAEGTVKRTVERLKQDFFANDPAEVITVWLFKDKSSYDTYTREFFQESHPSPYGYYSPRHRALIMNISTGSGTLVHEIVHPFMRTNFPKCPAWFNEGLGSLFEQCDERDGHLHGLPNWRLPGLQQVIRASKTIPFEQFTALSDADFYGGSSGYNQHYGQARYLCYYLQEHGLLIPFYREYFARVSDDPTGFLSLKKVLGTDDMLQFQRHWEDFVLKLHYP